MKEVRNNDLGLSCNSRCNMWTHIKCTDVSDSHRNHKVMQSLNEFVWYCPACDILNFDSSYYDTSLDPYHLRILLICQILTL